jgi:hypothetical protein
MALWRSCFFLDIVVVVVRDRCHPVVLRRRALIDNGDDVLLSCIGGVAPVRCAAVSLFVYQR